ncbi:MAG: ABC transporter ATP-binding protein [Vampirovibrionia bacterium]
MTNIAVELTDVSKSFGVKNLAVHALIDVSQQFNLGELSMVVGPSGCGKTTMISIIGGILHADKGTVNVFGEAIHKMTDDQNTEFRKNNIGYIFQQHNLIPTLTVKENVSIPLLVRKISRKQAEDRAMEVLDKVGLIHRADFYPRSISGGEHQRVAIARSLVNDPRLVICDEPTASLDSERGRQIVSLMREVAVQEDKCVIVVTHDSRIFKFADRMIKLEDGKIISDKYVKRRDI